MTFLPADKMQQRVGTAKTDSDAVFFHELLYLCEMVLKTAAAGLVAAVADDRERQRYRLIHRLVRADGVGEWAQAIDAILTGPPGQCLMTEAREEQKELTERVSAGGWQHEAVTLLHECLRKLHPSCDSLRTRVAARQWFELFTQIRNKSRGHGAPRSSLMTQVCQPLESSVSLLLGNFRLFSRPWAFLHRNLSGKYRVTPYTEHCEGFQYLTTSTGGDLPALEDGVYVTFGDAPPSRVELITSNSDASDFFFPNGSFDGKKFDLLSYLSGDVRTSDASPYLAPATALPGSETQGLGELEIQGKCFANLPPLQDGYVRRQQLEERLFARITDDRHPIVTLSGRGGIGKTWLALHVLHRVTEQGRFEAVFWFSARDIDLRPTGPRLVTPHVLTEKDIAREFVSLMDPKEAREEDFKPREFFATCLAKTPLNGPILCVFDNFETVRSPVELFAWLDNSIRLPNKVLITTRVREFRADYPVEVSGMTEPECQELISGTAPPLGIEELLTQGYRRELIEESEGHPYVIKVLLGEVAKAGKLTKIDRILASRDEILEVLFERTFEGLSPAARRVFLMLSSWRSTVAQLALEAVFLKQVKERIDVPSAVDELFKSSFIEVTRSEKDEQLFLDVPLVAAVFGRRKLEVSPMKTAIQADLPFLQAFGAAQRSATSQGVWPRIVRLFRDIARKTSDGREKLEEYEPMLEFVCRKFPPAWRLLAELYMETGIPEPTARALRALRRYLETSPPDGEKREAWRQIRELCAQACDVAGEIQALVEMVRLSGTSFDEISNAANRVNLLFRDRHLEIDTDEKRVLVLQLSAVMEERMAEGNATDFSRLAWLCLNAHDTDKARKYAEKGLDLEPHSGYCQNIIDKLNRDEQFRQMYH